MSWRELRPKENELLIWVEMVPIEFRNSLSLFSDYIQQKNFKVSIVKYPKKRSSR